MNNYYFTFGVGHYLGHKFQPIVAANVEDAREKMIEAHGTDWSSCYSESDFKDCLGDGIFTDLTPLEPLYVSEDNMTFGEMLEWTKRFNQILNGMPELVGGRLAQMMTDLEQAYSIPFLNNEEWNKRNPFVLSLYRAVSEARAL